MKWYPNRFGSIQKLQFEDGNEVDAVRRAIRTRIDLLQKNHRGLSEERELQILKTAISFF